MWFRPVKRLENSICNTLQAIHHHQHHPKAVEAAAAVAVRLPGTSPYWLRTILRIRQSFRYGRTTTLQLTLHHQPILRCRRPTMTSTMLENRRVAAAITRDTRPTRATLESILSFLHQLSPTWVVGSYTVTRPLFSTCPLHISPFLAS